MKRAIIFIGAAVILGILILLKFLFIPAFGCSWVAATGKSPPRAVGVRLQFIPAALFSGSLGFSRPDGQGCLSRMEA